MDIKDICEQNFLGFKKQSKLLEQDGGFEKVFLYEDQYIIKLFRHRKILSSSRLKNKAKKFRDNSLKLQKRNIPCSKVMKLFYLNAGQKRQCLVYNYIEGNTFYDTFTKAHAEDRDHLLKKLFGFFRDLHQKGIYFRSAHLANIIVQVDGTLALIDVGNIQFQNRPLSTFQVFRNFKAILRRKQDFKIFKEVGKEKMLIYYFGNHEHKLFNLMIQLSHKHPLHKLTVYDDHHYGSNCSHI